MKKILFLTAAAAIVIPAFFAQMTIAATLGTADSVRLQQGLSSLSGTLDALQGRLNSSQPPANAGEVRQSLSAIRGTLQAIGGTVASIGSNAGSIAQGQAPGLPNTGGGAAARLRR